MKIAEAKDLLLELERRGVDEVRLAVLLDPGLCDTLRKNYLVVLQDSVWGPELLIADKFEE